MTWVIWFFSPEKVIQIHSLIRLVILHIHGSRWWQMSIFYVMRESLQQALLSFEICIQIIYTKCFPHKCHIHRSIILASLVHLKLLYLHDKYFYILIAKAFAVFQKSISSRTLLMWTRRLIQQSWVYLFCRSNPVKCSFTAHTWILLARAKVSHYRQK